MATISIVMVVTVLMWQESRGDYWNGDGSGGIDVVNIEKIYNQITFKVGDYAAGDVAKFRRLSKC